MENLSQILSSQIDIIIERWVEIVQLDRKIETSNNLSDIAIRDHVPNILKALANVLSQFHESSDVESLVQNSLQHGCLRAAQGFEPTEITREYNLLQSIIISALKSELLMSSSAQVIQVFHLIDCTLNTALSYCFTSYTEERLRELEELNQIKDDFLNTVSHELRTPLTNMKMAIRMLKIASVEEQKKQYLGILEAECNRESDLINNILDLHRLEASSYGLSPKSVILQDWLPEIIQPFQVRIQAYQQILHISTPIFTTAIIIDCASLRRILVELLNNACKYTPLGGEIYLSIYHKPDPGEMVQSNILSTIFTVKNQANIAAAELSRIFEKFYRIPNSDTSKQGGTGLGLALVQKLVEQMQGTIHVESFAGWTTFTVELPNQLNF